MVILEKLLEKKDVLAYADWRMRLLKLEKIKVPKITKPQDRQYAIKQVNGRILEIKQLKIAVLNGIRKASEDACACYYKTSRELGIEPPKRKSKEDM